MLTETGTIVYQPHIAKSPEVFAGAAYINGTRTRVADIVAMHLGGSRPDQMLGCDVTRLLTLGEVHCALAYYYDHQGEIDALLAESEAAHKRDVHVKRRMRQRRRLRVRAGVR